MASTITHAMITSEVAAPAAILAISFKVVGRSISEGIGGLPREPSKRCTPCGIKSGGEQEAKRGRRSQVARDKWQETSGRRQMPGESRRKLRRPGAPFAGYEGAPEPALRHHFRGARTDLESKSRACFRRGHGRRWRIVPLGAEPWCFALGAAASGRPRQVAPWFGLGSLLARTCCCPTRN